MTVLTVARTLLMGVLLRCAYEHVIGGQVAQGCARGIPGRCRCFVAISDDRRAKGLAG
jgi:hypothetical protein